MRSIESTGKTVEEAVQSGLAKLNLELSDVTFEVIDNGSKGFFGLFGAKPAKVRITERDQEPDIDMSQILRPGASTRVPTMVDKQPRQQPRPAQPAREPKPAAQPRSVTPQAARAAVNANREAASQKTGIADGAAAVAAMAKETRMQHQQQPAAPRSDKPAAEAARAAKPAVKPAAAKPAQPGAKPAAAKPAQPRPPRTDAKRPPRRHDDVERIHIPDGPLPDQDPATLSETGRRAYEYLAKVTQLMGVNVKIYVAENSSSMSISMMGDTLGILIGRRGDTLDALQYLVSLEVNKDRDDYLRVSLDTENYRAKREDSLNRLADRMAARAVKTGRKVVLEPMNPYERRVLHSTLQNHPYVQTHSEGDEPNRRVVITLRTDVTLPEATEADAPAERPARAPRPARPHDRREGGDTRSDKPRGPRPQRPVGPRPERVEQPAVKPVEEVPAPVAPVAVNMPLAHDIPSDPTDDTI